jgi:hemerythrin-like domain-containing protein
MQPAGPLMIEHRLIERAVPVMQAEVKRLEKENTANREFVVAMVDFFRTYADRCHHGKEEDILFRALENKKLSAEHKKILDELLEEHIFARKNVKILLEATDPREIKAQLNILIELYPKHIETEDKRFFIPVMDYFSEKEQKEMLEQMWEFDKKLIHEKYGKIMEGLEQAGG